MKGFKIFLMSALVGLAFLVQAHAVPFSVTDPGDHVAVSPEVKQVVAPLADVLVVEIVNPYVDRQLPELVTVSSYSDCLTVWASDWGYVNQVGVLPDGYQGDAYRGERAYLVKS